MRRGLRCAMCGCAGRPDNRYCTKCNAGSYAAASTTECVPCATGTIDHDADPTTVCSKCPTGKSTNGKIGTSVVCFACKSGFGTVKNKAGCIDCVKDYGSRSYVDGGGACATCGKGEQPTPDLSACMACPPGKVSPVGDYCVSCNVGQQPSSLKDVCDLCIAGKARLSPRPISP